MEIILLIVYIWFFYLYITTIRENHQPTTPPAKRLRTGTVHATLFKLDGRGNVKPLNLNRDSEFFNYKKEMEKTNNEL